MLNSALDCRVPAAHHPEIAPGEFEEYLRTTNALANRQRSRVKRRTSILSNSFTAKDAQLGEEKEAEVCEGMTEKVPEDGEGRQQRRSRLRRSMSLDTITAAGLCCKREKKEAGVLCHGNILIHTLLAN